MVNVVVIVSMVAIKCRVISWQRRIRKTTMLFLALSRIRFPGDCLLHDAIPLIIVS